MVRGTVLFALFLAFLGVNCGIPMSACTPGRITYYDYSETNNGHCGYGPMGGATLKYPYIVAPNTKFYNSSWVCGECYEITGPTGTQIVMVADECPADTNTWCNGAVDHFDLGPDSTTFGSVANVQWGVTMISKRLVACPLSGNVGIKTKDSVSATWMALLIFNHVVGISKVELQPTSSSSYFDMKRQVYNYWIYSGGPAIAPPYKVRITGTTGQSITMTITDLAPQKIWTTDSQFTAPSSWAGFSSTSPTCSLPAPSSTVYDNSLYKGLAPSISWSDTSYYVFPSGSSVNYASTVSPYSGTACISFQLTSYGGFQMQRPVGFQWRGVFTDIVFYARSASPFNNLSFKIGNSGNAQALSLTTSWSQFKFSLSAIGAPATIGGGNNLMWVLQQSGSSPVIYIDDIYFVTATVTTTPAPPATQRPPSVSTIAPTPTPSTQAPATPSPTTKPTSTPAPATPSPTATPAPTAKPATGSGITIQLAQSSSFWWMAFTITGDSSATSKLELQDANIYANKWTSVTPTTWGQWTFAPSGAITLPISLRLTSKTGSVIVVKDIYKTLVVTPVNTNQNY